MSDVPKCDDKEILKLLKNEESSEKGFRLLMGMYKVRLYHHIRQLVGNHEDADDVLQNVFIKVFRNINNFEEKSGLYTWLYRIATNESLTFIQSQKRKQTISIDDVVIDISDKTSEEFFDEKHLQIKLEKAIDLLPAKQKAVFHLRYYDEMTYEDMSSILDTSVGALKASYHHAVKKIESFIKGID
jgi:RNA polymerase sigma factor (sigma-70 family)